MRIQALILGATVLVAGCAHHQPRGLSETDLSVYYQRLSELSGSPQADILKKFTEYWVRSLEQGNLPGFNKELHGNMDTYYLTPEVRKEWLKDKNIDREMFSDLGDQKVVFFVSVVTTTKEYVRHFFYQDGDTFALHSAYKWENGQWLRLFP